MKPVFIGSGVAIVTPFDKDGKVDFGRFKKNIKFQLKNKTDAIIVSGTTGEGSTLSVDERLELFSLAVETVNKRIPVIVGTGSNSTYFSLNLAKQAEQVGVDAHLMVTPYYNKTSQDGLIKHYYYIADRTEKPIIVYNVPSRTGMNIKPETYKKLSEHENIVAVKEADTDIAKLTKSIILCEDKLDFYIGNDDLITVACALGCKGVISVVANILPAFTHNLTNEAIKGNIIKSREMQMEIFDLIEALFCDVNPIPVKFAMSRLGMCFERYRMPLTDLSNENKKRILEIINKHKDKLL